MAAPYRRRTPGRRWLRFERGAEDPRDPTPPQWVRGLIAEHYAALEARIGVSLTGAGRTVRAPLGCGSYGCVFDLGDGRAFKVTSDMSEGPMSLYVRRLQQQGARTRAGPVSDVTTRIDDVFQFPGKVRVPGMRAATIYGIVRERAGEVGAGLTPKLMRAAELYTNGWDLFQGADVEGGRVIGAAMARAGLGAVRRAGPQGRRLAGLMELAWDEGIPLMDLHPGNLAIREGGQVVVFDFGGSEDCLFVESSNRFCDNMVVRARGRFDALREGIPVLEER